MSVGQNKSKVVKRKAKKISRSSNSDTTGSSRSSRQRSSIDNDDSDSKVRPNKKKVKRKAKIANHSNGVVSHIDLTLNDNDVSEDSNVDVLISIDDAEHNAPTTIRTLVVRARTPTPPRATPPPKLKSKLANKHNKYE